MKPINPKKLQTTWILGAPITPVSKNQLIEIVSNCIKTKSKNFISFCDAHLAVRAKFDRQVQQALKKALLVVADGVGISLGFRVLSKKGPERLPGPIVFEDVIQYGLKQNWRHFFYGGKKGVADELKKKMKAKYPELIVAGVFSPPYKKSAGLENQETHKIINETKPDILWVGLGAPKQEKWMNLNSNVLEVPVLMGVGAAFDFHSGKKRWAPFWIRRMGLEWVYRMFTGGRRVFFRNLKYEGLFAVLILWQAIFDSANKGRGYENNNHHSK